MAKKAVKKVKKIVKKVVKNVAKKADASAATKKRVVKRAVAKKTVKKAVKKNPAVKTKAKVVTKVKSKVNTKAKVATKKVSKQVKKEIKLYSGRAKTYQGYQGPDSTTKMGTGKYKTASEPIKVKGKEGRKFEVINRTGKRNKLPAGASAYIHEILEEEKKLGVPMTQALAIGYAKASKKFKGMPKQNPAIMKYINNPTPANLKGLQGVSNKEIEEAAKAYKTFTGREPEWIDEVDDKELPAFMRGKVWAKIADADAIQYKSDKWHKGKHDFYKHDFGKDNDLLTNPERNALIVINRKGKLKVKPEGIVG